MKRSRSRIERHGPVLALGMAWAGTLAGAPELWAFPRFEDARAGARPSEAWILDRNGEPLHMLRVDRKLRRLEWASLGEISPALKEAVVASEDKRFWSHGGVDWLALAKAATQKLLGGGTKRGASTISMQLASMLGPRPAFRRDFTGKAKQVFEARELEKSWSKEQILEAYLNLVSFRGELQGIRAASKGLFGKEPHGLTVDESLILAALIRSPEAREEKVAWRACELGKVLRGESYACDALETLAIKGELSSYAIESRALLVPQLAERLLEENRGVKGLGESRVLTSIDRKLQERVLDTLRKHVLSLRGKNARDAAALVVDNRSGKVLAYAGGVGELSSARYLDGAQAPRQAGSTLKPFLYALALESRYLTPNSLIDDSPVDIPIGEAVYQPRNYDRDFHGPVLLRVALGSSLNVPAVKTLRLVGGEEFFQRLKKLGFDRLEAEEYYGPSLALGAADITLWELVGAYRALANRGIWSSLSLRADNPPSPRRKAFSEQSAFLVSQILSDRENRHLSFGLESPLSLRVWAAVKTGTSKDMRDNWCVGYSDRYTVGVWVGNLSGEPMWDVSGITGAAPVWAELMNGLHERLPSRAPRAPKGVVRQAGEWFLAGTEPVASPRERGIATGSVAEKISYPANGMIIARDPDIPLDLQRVFFRVEGRAEGARWFLNGQDLGPVEAFEGWHPVEAGTFVLSLKAPGGEELDRVEFQVRTFRATENFGSG